jgi:hypothetical protein
LERDAIGVASEAKDPALEERRGSKYAAASTAFFASLISDGLTFVFENSSLPSVLPLAKTAAVGMSSLVGRPAQLAVAQAGDEGRTRTEPARHGRNRGGVGPSVL